MAEPAAIAEALLDALPQTQCTRCGYPDCKGYAEAIASTEADVNRCPPGGAEGISRLARIAGREALALDAACGSEAPRAAAMIDEAWCIGCALCLKACPVDAIVGAPKLMHSVIAELCTGCELCLPVCPVDCISLVNASGTATGWNAWSTTQAGVARKRYAAHQSRFDGSASTDEAPADPPDTARQAMLAAALARARGAGRPR